MWHGYMVIVLILAVAIVGYLVLRAGFDSLPRGLSVTATGSLLAGAASLNLLLAVISFATKPTGTNWQYGAYIGLAAAIVAVALPVRSVIAGRADLIAGGLRGVVCGQPADATGQPASAGTAAP
jgi:hypothetical protein